MAVNEWQVGFRACAHREARVCDLSARAATPRVGYAQAAHEKRAAQVNTLRPPPHAAAARAHDARVVRFPVARASLCLSLSIDTSAPATSKLKHMRCNHKRNKLNEERTQLIERDNSLLVQLVSIGNANPNCSSGRSTHQTRVGRCRVLAACTAR